MKSVMISIQPCWCEQIVAGSKTMDVRKNCPKLEPPFKCYIYETKARWAFDLLRKIGFDEFADILERGFGKVIGEFVCDYIRPFDVPYPAYRNELDKDILDQTCCTYYQLHRYAYHDKLYGWHISSLKAYKRPKRLSEFVVEGDCDCLNCKSCAWLDKGNGFNIEDDCNLAYENVHRKKTLKPIFRAPQSWCYVEELQDGK